MAWAAVTSQHAHGSGNAVASFTVVLPATPTTGNTIVLEIESFNGSGSAATTSVSGGGATWSEDTFTTYIDGSFQSRGSKYHGVVGATPSATITITVNNNGSTGGGSGSAQEYSGLLGSTGSADVDVAVSTHGTSGGTPTVTTGGTTTAANELVSGGYSDDGSNVTPTGKNGAGFTERDSSGASTVAESYLEDKDSGASGATQTANMSTAIGTFWAMTCVVYKISAGGGAAPVSPPMRTLRGGGP